MNNFENISYRNIRPLLIGLGILAGLFVISTQNLLLFHTVSRLISVVIAGGIFMFAWNSRRFLETGYLFILGVAYLFVGLIEITHILVIDTNSLGNAATANNSLQLWLFGRLLESSAFIIAALLINKKIKPYWLLGLYSLLSAVVLFCIIFSRIFLTCWIEGEGVTNAWIFGESIVLFLFIVSAVLLFYKRSIFRQRSLWYVMAAIGFSFLADVLFLFNPARVNFWYVLSQLFKLSSFYLLYKAIIEAGLVRPLNFLFENIRSNQRALRGKKEFAEKLIDIAQTILLVLDENAKVITCNPYLENIIGYKLEEIKGKSWFSNFVLEEDRKGIIQVFQKALDGRIIKDLIYPIRTRTGKERHIEWNMRIIKNSEDQTTGVLTSGQDITAHLNTKKQLLQYAEQLKGANINKDKFFNIIAHDLRNPLTSIINLGEQLSKDAVIAPRPRIKQSADKLLASVNRLVNLTENLLQWSLLQTGKLEFHPSKILIYQLISPNVELLAGNAQKKNISISRRIPKDILVFADHTMIDSVVQNLITNAIKFTNEGGKIKVDATPQGNFIEVSVIDTGIGMDKEKLNSLFKIENQQVTYGTAGERGTGLGLLLCKELIEKNNGQLFVKSRLNVGSTFLFTLPRVH